MMNEKSKVLFGEEMIETTAFIDKKLERIMDRFDLMLSVISVSRELLLVLSLGNVSSGDEVIQKLHVALCNLDEFEDQATTK
jgi:hypothetical protein